MNTIFSIQEETGLSRDSQLIVLANGVTLDPGDLAVQGYCESVSLLASLFVCMCVCLSAYCRAGIFRKRVFFGILGIFEKNPKITIFRNFSEKTF